MAMKFFFLTFIFLLLPFSAQAEPCPGYESAMNQLEDRLTQTAPPAQNTYRSRRAAPPIAAINAQIDELEAALKAREAANQAAAPAQSYPRRQKPSL
jgi:hypothetical protein